MPRGGFTLFELLMAILIFVVAVAGLVAAQDGCMTLAESARNMTAAMNGVRLMTEQIRSTPFANVAALNGPFPVPGWNVQHMGNIRVITTDPALFEVYVSVAWRQKKGRVFGEDQNLNGVLDTGEDLPPGNGRLDSPASSATLRADM